MPVRSSATWNAIMTGYCSQREAPYKYARKAIMLFKGMLLLVDDRGVRPTDTTLVCVLSAASQLGVVETGASVHGFIEKTIHRPENDVFIGTALVDMYSKCGSLDSAVAIFDRMRETNVWTWTAIITGLAFHGKGSEALQLLHTMESYGVKPNEVTFTSLLSACCHGGLVKEGLHLFHEMESRFGVTPRIQHYGCIVDLLGRAGQLKEAYEFIMSMPVDPDAVLWRSLLGSCKIHGDVLMGEKVGKHLLQLQTGRSNVQSDDSGEDYVALSNIYASADRWQEVEMIRDVIKVEGKENKPGFSIIQTVSSHDLDGIWDCVALGVGDRDQDS
ncbi:E motif [Dillenia turbinata]|uniref:E motif n=1 Tax=Dillenia turbinata TaxID=194707 RepID=A0AAN8YU77_9MAGN